MVNKISWYADILIRRFGDERVSWRTPKIVTGDLGVLLDLIGIFGCFLSGTVVVVVVVIVNGVAHFFCDLKNKLKK